MASEPVTHRDRPPTGSMRSTGRGQSPAIDEIRSVTVDPDTSDPLEGMAEWLVTNGLGGYASGTITGVVTRRFHGYLIAALPAPRGRTMMLNHLNITISTDDSRARLSQQGDPGTTWRWRPLREFRLELGLPVWTFEYQGNVVEQRVIMPHRQNTVLIMCKRLSGEGNLRISFDPWIQFRAHEGMLSGLIDNQYALRVAAGRCEIEDTLASPIGGETR